MLPDFTVYPSTSEKCRFMPDVILPDVDGPFEHKTMEEKKATRGQCPSKCNVCRHPATGYHYDVPSCNGCKTFFRRSILDGRKYSCLKMRKCLDGVEPVDLTRRMCRACRFEKCVETGMNPCAIQAEVKSLDGEELKKEILLKQKTSVNPEGLCIAPILSSFNEKVNQIIERLTRIEISIEPIYTRGLPAGYRDVRNLENILDSPVTLNTGNIPNLLYNPCSFDESTGEVKMNSACFIHTGILASLEYSKMFEFVRQIDFDSKLILMKHAAVMCTDIMTAFFSINNLKSDKLAHPNGQLSGPPRLKYGECGVKQQKALQKTLIAVLRNKMNRVEYLLLKAIVLCNPAVSGLQPFVQTVIEKEREQYVQALLTYCLLNHGSLDGPARFSALISITTVLENQQKIAKDFHYLVKAAFLKNRGSEFRRISPLYEQIMES